MGKSFSGLEARRGTTEMGAGKGHQMERPRLAIYQDEARRQKEEPRENQVHSGSSKLLTVSPREAKKAKANFRSNTPQSHFVISVGGNGGGKNQKRCKKGTQGVSGRGR